MHVLSWKNKKACSYDDFWFARVIAFRPESDIMHIRCAIYLSIWSVSRVYNWKKRVLYLTFFTKGKFFRTDSLTLIGKSLKTQTEIFPKFQFSRVLHRRISGKIIQYFFQISISGAWTGPISRTFIHQFFVSICRWVFQKSARVMRHDSCLKILKLNVGCVFHKSIQLIPRKFAEKSEGWNQCRKESYPT